MKNKYWNVLTVDEKLEYLEKYKCEFKLDLSILAIIISIFSIIWSVLFSQTLNAKFSNDELIIISASALFYVMARVVIFFSIIWVIYILIKGMQYLYKLNKYNKWIESLDLDNRINEVIKNEQ